MKPGRFSLFDAAEVEERFYISVTLVFIRTVPVNKPGVYCSIV